MSPVVVISLSPYVVAFFSRCHLPFFPVVAHAISLSPLLLPSRALLTFFPRFQLHPLPLPSSALLTFFPHFHRALYRCLVVPSSTTEIVDYAFSSPAIVTTQLLPVAPSSATDITFFPSTLLPLLLANAAS
ncbi:hypothetical protein BHE74_00042223 [Ensete ventricosum]|nr:hypothetical protein BHE74_00042223 [Ensete ventricosum]